jgi:hypothetical protein
MRNKVFQVECYGKNLVIEAGYTPAEKGDYMYPGYSAEVEIYKVELLSGEDVTEMVMEHIEGSEQTLKEIIFEKYEL